jgi:hypothetical protein
VDLDKIPDRRPRIPEKHKRGEDDLTDISQIEESEDGATMKQIKVQLYETTDLNQDPEYQNYISSNPDSSSEEQNSHTGPRMGMRLTEKKKLDRKKQREEKALFKSQEEF